MGEKTKSNKNIKWIDEATFELTINIPKKEVIEARQKAIASLAQQTPIPGFRKGKAPAKLVEEKLGKEEIYRQVINNLIPQAYLKALKKYSLSPIIEPKIVLTSTKPNEAWIVKATSCQLPNIKLENWQSEIKKINAVEKIWTPEKGKEEPPADKQEEQKQKKLQQIIQKIVDLIEVNIPSFWLETELNKKIVSLIDQLQTAGLTIEQYLSTKKKSLDELKRQYQKEIETGLKLELALEEVANQAKIQVNKEEVEALVQQSKKEKKSPSNPYLMAQMFKRQKTIAYLLNL